MKEYEIINNEILLGKVQIYSEFKNTTTTIIKSLINTKYKLLDTTKNQQNYIVSIEVKNIDDIIKNIEKYSDDIENTLEYLKKINNIKVIKKPIKIDFVIPKSHIKNFDVNLNNIDLKSLLESKIYFIKNTNKYNIDNLIIRVNNYLSSNEYEFMDETEKDNIFNSYIEETNKIISEIEKNTIYKYGRDFIRAIRISD